MSEANFPWKIEYALRKAALIAKGRWDGLGFALQVEGALISIQAEIERRESTRDDILGSSSFGDNNPMTLGASPRIYVDAYVEGLREALAQLEELGGSEPT